MHEKNPQTKFLSMQTYLTSGGGGGEWGKNVQENLSLNHYLMDWKISWHHCSWHHWKSSFVEKGKGFTRVSTSSSTLGKLSELSELQKKTPGSEDDLESNPVFGFKETG